MQDEWQGRTGASWAAEWRRTDQQDFGTLNRAAASQRTREFRFTDIAPRRRLRGGRAVAGARPRAAERAGEGVDISTQLVKVARDRASNLPNVAFEVADAAQWRPAEGFAPDLLVSRHGVKLFFRDPQAAFTNLAGSPRHAQACCSRASETGPTIRSSPK